MYPLTAIKLTGSNVYVHANRITDKFHDFGSTVFKLILRTTEKTGVR